MAKRLTQWPRPSRSNRIYPWEQWTDGSVWQITEGRDFHISRTSMAAQLHVRAAAQHLSCRVSQTETGLTFQYQPRKKATQR